MSPPSASAKITNCLWFESDAKAAVQYYIDLFNSSPCASGGPGSHVLRTTYYIEGVPHPCQDLLPPGSILTISFSLAGQKMLAMNAGPIFKFTPAISLMVECENQDEIDHFWNGFTEGKEERVMNCGWVNDRWGLSWQVVPKYIRQLAESDDQTKYNRMSMWMMMPETMPKKLVIEDLMKAAESNEKGVAPA